MGEYQGSLAYCLVFPVRLFEDFRLLWSTVRIETIRMP